MSKKLLLNKLGDHVQKKARAKFKSNSEFADISGVNEKTIRRIYSGKQNLTIKVLEKICIALEIKISDLFKSIEN